MERTETNHYAMLGLDRGCTLAQVRAAYRLLVKHLHPDVNPVTSEAILRTQKLNAAHEILSNPIRRRAYDRELAAPKPLPESRSVKRQRPLSRDVLLPIEDFLRGTEREVHFSDPANSLGPEVYRLIVPPETAPGTRFRLPRIAPGAGGYVQIRVRALPSFRFKVRGSDLRCDLRIKADQAARGGSELFSGVAGEMLRVQIPHGVERGQIIRLPGGGLPKPRGGRGDLLLRIIYRIDLRISHPLHR